MRMRKILSFVLVLSLVLGSFSMAFAASPTTGLSDIAKNANEDAIQVNNDLGIITGFPDGTFKPEQAVNRAEFAAMITRALAIPESALAGYTASAFKDMSGYGWAAGYIGFCQSKGIMLGDGQGNAMPGRTISVNEAMTMVLRAIGYVNHSSELVGVWPSNYVTVAQNVGLYEDVAATLTVDRANAAQIIYNALTVQKVAVNADGKTEKLTLTGSTEPAVLFNTGLGAKKQEAAPLDINQDSKINLVKYAGMYGSAYTKNDSIVAFVVDSTNVTGKVKNSTDELKAADKTYSFKTADMMAEAYPHFVNGKRDGTDTVNSFDDGQLTVINGSVSGRTINKVYSISTWEVTVGKKAAAADIADIANKEFAGVDFTKADGEIDYNSFMLEGVKSLEDIKKDNVVYIYTDNNSTSGKIVKLAVGTEVVTGKVTAYSSTDKNFVVNGKTYQTASEAGVRGDVPKAFNAEDLGKDVELYLDAYGYVFDYKVTSADTSKYGVIEKYSDSGVTNEIRLYTAADDASKRFVLTDKANNVVSAAALGSIVGYALNKDGAISEAVLSQQAAAGTLNGVRSITLDGSSYVVSSSVTVFTVSPAGAGTNVALSSIDKIKTGVALGAVHYVVKDNKVVALTVDAQHAGKASDSVYFVINATTGVYDAAEDANLIQITGLMDGAKLEKKQVKGDTAATVQTNTTPVLWTAKITADGFLKGAETTTAVTANNGTVWAVDTADSGAALSTTAGGVATVYDISKNAVVYELVKDGTSFDKYAVSNIGSVRRGYTAYLYATLPTTDSKYDGYDIVIFVKN